MYSTRSILLHGSVQLFWYNLLKTVLSSLNYLDLLLDSPLVYVTASGRRRGRGRRRHTHTVFHSLVGWGWSGPEDGYGYWEFNLSLSHEFQKSNYLNYDLLSPRVCRQETRSRSHIQVLNPSILKRTMGILTETAFVSHSLSGLRGQSWSGLKPGARIFL